MRIGEKIRELRRRHRLSQDEFGAAVTINGRLISRYENGRYRPSPPTLERIARTFAVPVEVLADDDAPLPPPRPRGPDDPELAVRFAELGRLPDHVRQAVVLILDAVIATHAGTKAS